MERKLLSREPLRALIVFALFCLNFVGHPNPAIAYSSDLTPYVVAADWSALCAGDLAPHGDHAPCHACRIGFDLDVPPPPAIAACAGLVAVLVDYPGRIVERPRAAVGGTASARGPPTP